MAATPYNIIAGPATVYIAATGTAFPAFNATPNGSWTNLGRTTGGVRVRKEETVQELMVDQVPYPVKGIRTEQRVIVQFVLAEITLETMVKVLDNQTITTTGSPEHSSFNLANGFDVPQWSMLVRGPSMYANVNMQYELPIVIQRAAPELNFTREGRAEVQTEWLSLEDPAAATAGAYGKIRAGTGN